METLVVAALNLDVARKDWDTFCFQHGRARECHGYHSGTLAGNSQGERRDNSCSILCVEFRRKRVRKSSIRN